MKSLYPQGVHSVTRPGLIDYDDPTRECQGVTGYYPDRQEPVVSSPNPLPLDRCYGGAYDTL